ncbi:MAG: FtsH protease activity modulator HflK [Gammaproteobacteria bacterium]|nr:FtsH protease activity modulator HflK [Gammaproteobacteria bacterium]
MGWNEPPGGNKGRDPWGDRGNGGGPPDLDEIVRRMQQGFGGLLGRRGGAGRRGSPMIWLGVIGAIVALLLFDITYFIDQQERGVVLRLGRYVSTLQPGLNVVFPSVIDKVIPVNVGLVRSITHKATMLTQDENIVDVEIAVQWRINEAGDYVFNVENPAGTLRQVAESAVRQVIGKSKLDFVLTEGRSAIAQSQQQLMQKILNDYRAGILIVTVEMQPAKPPEQVKNAFDDAIKAREDEQRLVNEAEAYRNDIIPRSRGSAARLREEANAYKATVIARGEGEAARFEQLLAEYQRAPAVTRQRLYLDSMESVLSKTPKVLLDSRSSNNMMYLPLDRLLDRPRLPADAGTGSDAGGSGRSVVQSMQEISGQSGARSRPER